MSIFRTKTYRKRKPEPPPPAVVPVARPDNMLTTKEAADYLGIHVRSVVKAVARGRLRAYRWGTGEKAPFLFKVDELKVYQSQRAQRSTIKPGRKSGTDPSRWRA